MNLFWFVVGIAISVIIVIWLILKGSHGVPENGEDSYPTRYAGTISEGHGGLTIFLWISFVIIFGWTIVYFIQHWKEFQAIFNL